MGEPGECGTRCEAEFAFSHIPGNCNETNGRCICAEGFDGLDDWLDFNDCHINNKTRYIVRIILMTSCVLAFLVSFLSLVVVARRKDSFLFHLFRRYCYSKEREREYRRRHRHRSKAASSVAMIQPNIEDDERNRKGSEGANTARTGMTLASHEERKVLDLDLQMMEQFRRDQDEMKQDININSENFNETGTLGRSIRAVKQGRDRGDLALVVDVNLRLTVLCFIVMTFAASNFGYLYLLEFYGGKVRSRGDQDLSLVLDLLPTISAGFLISAIWYMIGTLYHALPDLRVFGRIFALSNIIIRNPTAFNTIYRALWAISLLLIALFGTILPQSIPEKRDKWNRGIAIALFLISAAALVSIISVLSMLIIVFRSALKVVAQQLKEFEEKRDRIQLRDPSNNPPPPKRSADISLFGPPKPGSSVIVRDDQVNDGDAIHRETSIVGSAIGVDDYLNELAGTITSVKRRHAETAGTVQTLSLARTMMATMLGPAPLLFLLLISSDIFFSNLFIFFGFVNFGGNVAASGLLALIARGYLLLDYNN